MLDEPHIRIVVRVDANQLEVVPALHGVERRDGRLATRRLLLDDGYHRLTFEAVASAAGTSRSTVYRWWPTRGTLVVEAAADSINIGEVPDTGDSRTDIQFAIRQLIETFSDRLAGIVIMAAIANLDNDMQMATTFRETAVYPWRRTAADALQRAIDRGDLAADTDVQFVLNVIVGTVFQCTITPAAPMTDGLEDGLLRLAFPAQRDDVQGRRSS